MGGVSASTIKSWFQYRCERKTRYELMDPAELLAIPVLADERESALSDFGVEYEQRVMRRLRREASVAPIPAGAKVLGEAATRGFLRRQRAYRFAAQANMWTAKPMPLLANVPQISLRRGYADLIRCDDSGLIPLFRIIDIKATRRPSAFHKAQVAFYARVLQAMLRELGAPGEIDPTGSIWRLPDDGSAEGDAWFEDDFALGPYLRLVDDFARRTLPEIATKRVAPGVDQTFFHIYFKCEQCHFLPQCQRAIDPALAPQQRDVSATPGLTQEAKRTLHAHGIRSVAQLADAAGLRRLDGAGWALSRRAETLVSRAQALQGDAVQRAPEPHTFLMPPRADVALYLIADHDPVDDTLVTLGYRKSAGGTSEDLIRVIAASDRQAEADVQTEVFTHIIADLEVVDRQNAAAGDAADTHAHIFIYEPAEAVALQNAVKRHLDDPRVRNGLLHMVRLFPPEDVVPEPEFRGLHHLPATALRSVVEQLFALPVTVSYDLRQVSEALAAKGLIAQAYAPGEAFRRDFSSLLSIDVARGLRDPARRMTTTQAEVEADVRARLAASEAIAGWLRREHEAAVAAGEPPLLRLAKRPFRLQASFDPLDAGDLDVLRAFELLESRSGLLQTLIGLAQPKRARRDAGRCMADLRRLPSKDRTGGRVLRFAIPPESRSAEIGPDTLGVILTDDDPDVRLDQTRWREVACRVLRRRPGDDDGVISVFVTKAVYDGPVFREMLRRSGDQGWCLDVSFIDVNADKADRFLGYLGGAPRAA
jgi:hypothetical protein